MRFSRCLVFVAAVLAVSAAAPAPLAGRGPGQPDVNALLQHLDDLYRSKSSIARFGADRPEDITALLATPSFVGRFLRGDMQILSKHAIGAAGSYDVSPEIAYAVQWLHNPRDHSGIMAPAMTYTFGDAVSLLGSVYLPYGRPPQGGVLRSEYGAAPRSVLLQLRWYF